MALIRGFKGNCTCPVCLVPHDQQSELATAPLYPLRKMEDAASVIASTEMSAGEKETALKKLGLRPVAVSTLNTQL